MIVYSFNLCRTSEEILFPLFHHIQSPVFILYAGCLACPCLLRGTDCALWTDSSAKWETTGLHLVMTHCEVVISTKRKIISPGGDTLWLVMLVERKISWLHTAQVMLYMVKTYFILLTSAERMFYCLWWKPNIHW